MRQAHTSRRRVAPVFAAALIAGAPLAQAEEAPSTPYRAATQGTRMLSTARSDLAIKVLVERANLGSDEVEVAEISFPAGEVQSLARFFDARPIPEHTESEGAHGAR